MKPYCNLLIVDDEPLITESLSSMDEWSERNIRVVGTAATGHEALAWVERQKIDIVITDIQMPDMDGLELIQTLNESHSNISVIVISGYEKFEYAFTALKYKAKGYVLKPIDTDELFDIIDDIMTELPTANSATESDSEEGTYKTYHQQLVEKTIAHMQQNLSESLTLNEMAQLSCLTPHYFGQIFKAVTGEYYTNYLTRLRMEKACELLKNPELKNYEISSSIGYKDVKYFTRIFQKTYNMTPKEYRKRYFNRK